MLRFFKFLFTGSWHECKWETIAHGNFIEKEGGIAIGKYFYLRCKECGKHKKESFHV